MTSDHRAQLIDWMVEIQESYNLNHEALYLAVKLVDLYLERVPNVEVEELQLLAGTCIFISAKFEVRFLFFN